jgi:hypothetical protein
LASSERQLQLERAAEEWTEASGQAYQEMQARYREMRHLLFTFLTAYSDAELNLRQRAQGLQGALDAGSTIKLNALVAQGLSFFVSSRRREDIPKSNWQQRTLALCCRIRHAILSQMRSKSIMMAQLV